MKVVLHRKNDAFHFQGVNEEGAIANFDAKEEIGGQNLGVRPMQMLLMSLAACSGIDIVSILKKMKQPLEDLTIEVEGERERDVHPSLFKDIHVKFIFKGDLAEDRVKYAVELSMEKYCSVATTLRPTANITYSYEIQRS